MSKRSTLTFTVENGRVRASSRHARLQRGRARLLRKVRTIAECAVEQHSLRLMTIEDVLREADAAGIDARALGSALGAVFRGGGWRPTAWFVRIPRSQGRRRALRVWEFTGAEKSTSWSEDRRSAS